MNIIGIIGSLREPSVHQQIAAQYQEICRDFFTLEQALIGDIPLYRNIAVPDSVEALSQKIKAAEGIIFFAPEYNHSISGALKNTIDWLSRYDPQPFAGKPATIIGASPGNIGTARMQPHLRQVGAYLDLYFLNKPEIMIGSVLDKMKDGRLHDQKTLNYLLKHAEAFRNFVLSHSS